MEFNSITPIGTSIIFEFVQDTSGGSFDNKTTWGFVIRNKEKDLDIPRWGRVLYIGDDVKNTKIDDYILIEPLMWTLSTNLNGVKCWKTAEEKLIMKSDAVPAGIR